MFCNKRNYKEKKTFIVIFYLMEILITSVKMTLLNVNNSLKERV